MQREIVMTRSSTTMNDMFTTPGDLDVISAKSESGRDLVLGYHGYSNMGSSVLQLSESSDDSGSSSSGGGRGGGGSSKGGGSSGGRGGGGSSSGGRGGGGSSKGGGGGGRGGGESKLADVSGAWVHSERDLS